MLDRVEDGDQLMLEPGTRRERRRDSERCELYADLDRHVDAVEQGLETAQGENECSVNGRTVQGNSLSRALASSQDDPCNQKYTSLKK